VSTAGDSTGLPGQFSAFNATTRYGIASSQQSDGSYNLTVVFGGTRSYTANAVFHSNVSGIYKMSFSAYKDASGANLTTASVPRKVVEVGDSINGHAISQFDMWDPIAKSGAWIAFWLGFSDSTSAIVRSN
jgi:hypothetical protein